MQTPKRISELVVVAIVDIYSRSDPEVRFAEGTDVRVLQLCSRAGWNLKAMVVVYLYKAN